MASKIFTTQNWRVICDTEEEQATATALQILAKGPDGVTNTFSATIDTDTTRIYYDVAVAEFAVRGDYHVWPKTTISGNVAPGDPAVVTIYTEGT
jgi:hypothetical protein